MDFVESIGSFQDGLPNYFLRAVSFTFYCLTVDGLDSDLRDAGEGWEGEVQHLREYATRQPETWRTRIKTRTTTRLSCRCAVISYRWNGHTHCSNKTQL